MFPIFSKDECKRLIESGEEIGFGKTNFQKEYRGNLRIISKDTSLSEAIWERLKPVIPATLTQKEDFFGKPSKETTWDAVGLNEVWRCAKYHPGD